MGRATNTEYKGLGIAHKWPILPTVGTQHFFEMFSAAHFVKLYSKIGHAAPCKQLEDIQYILFPGRAAPPQQVGLMASLPSARTLEEQTS